MVASDPTARDDEDLPKATPGNVDPPEGLAESLGDEAQDGEAPSEGDGDVAPTGEAVLDR